MPLGKKVFDIYGELHLDKDEVRQGLRGLAGEMGQDADRAGQDLGKRMSEGLAKSVEQSSARVAKARRAEVDAANAVKVAELRLNEAREKGKAPASQMLALENSLEKAHYRLAQAQSNTVTSTKKLEDAQRLLAKSMGDAVDKDLGPRMQRSGEDAGGKLAMGMRMQIIRSSPMIAAAVAGGLIAGGPAVLTAATGLFAGIGIVAAAQSQRVQSAWSVTWGRIWADTQRDAHAIEPVLVGLASKVGGAFQEMRPQVEAAFNAAAPQIEVFAGGLLKLTQNALPGFVHAVEAGMPVTRGFADFLAKTGTGMTDFLDRITAHAPAAGQVFSQLGDTMDTLLPMLGELIGQGAELGATVLPMLNGGLGLLLGAVEHLGGALPVVVGYFSAMKIINTVGGWVSSAGAAFSKLGTKDIPLVSTAAGKMGGALSSAGAAATAGGAVTGALALTLGLLMAAHQQSEQRIRTWTQALGQGGEAARAAREEMAAQDEQVRKATSGFTGFITSLTVAAPALNEMKGETEAAEEANRKYVASLSPIEVAHRNLTIAEDALSEAIKKHGSGSVEAASAADRYRAAQAEVERQEGQVQLAIEGVTQAMIDQANQAMASIDSSFAYRDAQNQLEDAQKALTDAIREHGKGSEEAQRAQLGLEEQTFKTAQAFGQQEADLSGLKQGTNEYTAYAQEQTLAMLYELQKQAGPGMQAAIGQQIAALQAGGVAMSASSQLAAQLTGQVNGLTGAVHAVPNQKYVQIDAPTAAQVQQLQNLGYYVQHLPNGSVYVYANTRDAEAAIAGLTKARTAVINVLQHILPAAGGKIGDYTQGLAIGGQVRGPGTTTSDSVGPFSTRTGQAYLSDQEWIIRAASANKYGATMMQAVNDGRAVISLPGRGAARPGLNSTAAPPNPATGTGAVNSPAQTFHIGSVSLVVPGAFNLGSGSDKRKLIAEIAEGLVDYGRSRSRT